METKTTILQKLISYNDPELGANWIYEKALKRVEMTTREVEIELGYPIADKKEALFTILQTQLPDFKIHLSWKVASHAVQPGQSHLPGVKNIIAVGSGKGGVGKTTTTVNLATALAVQGARVGILDADIYGPNQPLMLGINEKPDISSEKKFKPLIAHGVQSMSIGYLLAKDAPVIWRGPMISQALQQMLFDTLWDDLDYLLIDLPPGTGDIALTLAKKAPLAGAVIVTTPQTVSFLDAYKALRMFEQLQIPVLGIIENMSSFVCSRCGHSEMLFGEGAGAQLATLSHQPLWSRIPLHPEISKTADAGYPIVLQTPTHPITKAYLAVARALGAALALRPRNYASSFPKVVVESIK